MFRSIQIGLLLGIISLLAGMLIGYMLPAGNALIAAVISAAVIGIGAGFLGAFYGSSPARFRHGIQTALIASVCILCTSMLITVMKLLDVNPATSASPDIWQIIQAGLQLGSIAGVINLVIALMFGVWASWYGTLLARGRTRQA